MFVYAHIFLNISYRVPAHVPGVYVFRVEPLALDGQLVCSSLARAVSPGQGCLSVLGRAVSPGQGCLSVLGRAVCLSWAGLFVSPGQGCLSLLGRAVSPGQGCLAVSPGQGCLSYSQLSSIVCVFLCFCRIEAFLAFPCPLACLLVSTLFSSHFHSRVGEILCV
jgi:hypothetical protein